MTTFARGEGPMCAVSSAVAAASRAGDSATGLGATPLSEVLGAWVGGFTFKLSFKDCLDDWRDRVPLLRVMVVDARRMADVIRFLREDRGEPDDVESDRLGLSVLLLGLGEAMAAGVEGVDQEGRGGRLEAELLDRDGVMDSVGVYIRVAAGCLAVCSRRAGDKVRGAFSTR